MARNCFFSSGRTHDGSLDLLSRKHGTAPGPGLFALLIASMIALALPAYAQVKSAAPAAPVAPGDYRLIGTMEGNTFTGAVLVDSTGLQTFYRLNEVLPDGSRLVKVGSYSVVVKQSDDTSSELYINHDMKAAPQTDFAASPPASPPATAGSEPLSTKSRGKRLTDEKKSQAPSWMGSVPDAARPQTPRQRRRDRSHEDNE